MLQMHHSLYGLLCDPEPPPHGLDIRTFAARCLHAHTMREILEILAAKGGTVGENVGR